MNRITVVGCVLGIGAGILAAGALPAIGQPEGQGQPGGEVDLGAVLIEGLQKTEGCLGVDAAQMMSGKNSIFAWFENKAAAERWYYSPTHQQFMAGYGGQHSEGKPMAHITDLNTPIMVIASITYGGEQAVPGPIPFSQISIELFAPLPGGAMVNGRLSPDAFEVEHMRDLTPTPGSDG